MFKLINTTALVLIVSLSSLNADNGLYENYQKEQEVNSYNNMLIDTMLDTQLEHKKTIEQANRTKSRLNHTLKVINLLESDKEYKECRRIASIVRKNNLVLSRIKNKSVSNEKKSYLLKRNSISSVIKNNLIKCKKMYKGQL